MSGKRPRTERRERERAQRKLARDRQRLAELSPGGTPERPITVPSSSVIPVRARSLRCPLCDGEYTLGDETATADRRAVQVTCRRCGVGRRIWFALGSPLPS